MNRVNYLFDDCVPHRSTLKVQREAEEFFATEEAKFYEEYYAHESKEPDEYGWKPSRTIPITSWDQLFRIPHWDDQWQLDIKIEQRRVTQYKGYIYRYMSVDEYNKYITHSLPINNKEWNDETECSHNIGYCFLGEHSQNLLHEWRNFNLEPKDLYSDLTSQMMHVGMIHPQYKSTGEYDGSWEKVIQQDVYCKFYYEGPIYQSIAYYGEHDPYDGDVMNNYMIEYGLPDYSKARLIDAIFNVKETSVYNFYGSLGK
jgi:hypothetical protein